MVGDVAKVPPECAGLAEKAWQDQSPLDSRAGLLKLPKAVTL